MQVDAFVVARRTRWEELDALLKRAGRKSVRGLSGDDVLQLGRLYRLATSDLAIAQRDFPNDRVALYLNGLVARAHPLVYQESAMDVQRIGRFVRYGFPAAYRKAGRYTAIAFALFLISAFVSALLVLWRPTLADVLLPGTAQSLRAVMQQHHLWMQQATENHSVAANFIMTNNIRVAFVAFAGGLLLGTVTVYVMLQNGIMLGTIGAMVHQYGLSRQLWSFILPHGVIELSVIFMAGGAGLMIADSILRPGLRRRTDALVAEAHHVVRLLAGAVPLMIIAGTIEGFFSPSNAPDGAKLLVGLLTGMLLYGYLLLSRPSVHTMRSEFLAGGGVESDARGAVTTASTAP